MFSAMPPPLQDVNSIVSTSQIRVVSSPLSTGQVASPSALPPSVASLHSDFPNMSLSSSPLSPPRELSPPPSIPPELLSSHQPAIQPAQQISAESSAVAAAGLGSAVPPPPTMGFVPSHGIVASHPAKVVGY